MSRKKWNGRKISYFAQFSIVPLGVKFNFPPKVSTVREKKINIRFWSRVQGWIGNWLERGVKKAGGESVIRVSAASWLQPNVKALSQNGHPVLELSRMLCER